MKKSEKQIKKQQKYDDGWGHDEFDEWDDWNDDQKKDNLNANLLQLNLLIQDLEKSKQDKEKEA